MDVLKVYYIDDEPDLLEIFKDTFETDWCFIETFKDPLSALKLIHQCPPDLIFLDLRMPGMTGMEIGSKIDIQIPKFLITGDLTVASSPHFLSILEKPLKINQVVSILEMYRKKKFPSP